MRWIILLLSVVMFKANASLPTEILASYLERHEMCVKDARIRANNQKDFIAMKDQCRIDYMNMVDGVADSVTGKSDNSAAVTDWKRYVNFMSTLKEFKIEGRRHYLTVENRAVLGDFYITRNKGVGKGLLIWKGGLLVNDYKAIPLSDALMNARYVDGRIAILGLDSDVVYYATRQGNSFSFETGYGNQLGINASLFLADKAVLVYNDEPIGIITRKIAREIN